MPEQLDISIDLDALTIGDLESLESGSIAKILLVFDHTVSVKGHEIRDLHYSTLQQIAQAIRAAVEAQTNPVVGGKN